MNLKEGISGAVKWSSITQIITKVISPITQMILARILSPEHFGVLATILIVTSFSDMITDVGFQKYLIQFDFKSEIDKKKTATVAFWTNLIMSLFIWFIIAIFSESISSQLGSPGLGIVLVIACVKLPITSISSIQIALFQRNFDFKSLFFIRIIGAIIPLIITLPLAILGFSYWSLIIGLIVGEFSNAVLTTIKSDWKPNLYYNFRKLKRMLSFSLWVMTEGIFIWLTAWIDSFIIGSFLSTYYLGIYNTSLNLVSTLMGIVSSVTMPIFFSALSRLKNDDELFNLFFFKTIRLVAFLLFPIGIIGFLYSDIITLIMFGNKWIEASGVIGIWVITSSILIVLSGYNSEVFKAKGKPKLSLISQVIHLFFLVPTCLISIKYGFWTLVYARSFIRFQGLIVGLIFLHFFLKIRVIDVLKNIFTPFYLALLTGILAFGLNKISTGFIWELLSIAFCAFFYFLLLYFFARKEVKSILDILKH